MKVNNGKTTQVSNVIKTVIDKDGVVIEQEIEKVFVTKTTPDNFFMCFFENFAGLYGLKNIADMKLIACMCEIAQFNTGVVQMSTKVRREIAGKTGISVSNISKNLKRLKDAHLISGEDGEYVINPAVFWKGSTAERTKLIMNGGLSFNIKIEGVKTKKTVMEPSKAFGE